MDTSLITSTLLSAPVLAFVLGVIAVAIRSDLKIPEALTATLSIYLLLSIGLKGGVALRDSQLSELVVPLLLGLTLGILIPWAVYGLLKVITPYSSIDRGAIAAHYGSTSLVTFTAALVTLEALAIDVPGYAYALLTALEIPGIVMGLFLAKRRSAKGALGKALHELLTGTSIFLMVGGLVIGAVIGSQGYQAISPVFTDAFRGVLVLFLLALGIKAASGFSALRNGGHKLVAFAVVFPLAVMSLVTVLGSVIGLGVGGAVVLAVLSASASYIAAPAAVKLALPEANLALPLTASLSVTFPVNLIVGIPLSVAIATGLA